MNTAALILVLAAAGLHAGWNLLVHQAGDRLATLAVGGIVGGMLLLPAVVIQPPTRVWGLVLLSGLVEAVYGALLAGAYARGALAVVYPVGRGSAPLLVTAGSWVVLGQRPSPLAVVAALALAVGLATVAGVGRQAGQLGAVGFALATGASIATYSVIDALAVRSTAPAGYLGAVLLAQGCVLLALRARQPGTIRAALRPGSMVALGVVGAYLLVLLAFQRADAGRVATLREVSVLIVVAASAQRRNWVVWTGALLVCGGVMAAAW